MVTIPQAVLNELKAAIAERFGIYIRPQDDAQFCKKIHGRVQALKLSTYEAYSELLSTASDLSQSEWRELIRQVTIAETYFMRDKGHINLLQNNILPELIAAQRSSKTLRIWSAGCSTGEEAYSIAILLHELIPDLANWRLRIIGSDLNPEVVQKARQATYSDWSLRSLTDKQKSLYFTQQGALWRLHESLCKMVSFYSNNLVDDHLSQSSDFRNFDLILCRNVFIYFEPKAIKKVLRRFQEALKPKAYLITGHMELHGQNLDGFKVNVFPDAVVYQRSDRPSSSFPSNTQRFPEVQNHCVTPPPLPTTEPLTWHYQTHPASFANFSEGFHQKITDAKELFTPSATPLSSSDIQTDWDRLGAATQSASVAEYRQALRYLDQIQEPQRHILAIHQLRASVYANLGDLKSAYHHCQQVIKLDPNSPRIYYLMAHVADEMGKHDEVKQLLKKAIYLDLHFVAAYLALGDIYGRESDRDRALKMYRSTIDILKALPSDQIVPETDLTPLELIPQVEERMRWIGVGFSL